VADAVTGSIRLLWFANRLFVFRDRLRCLH
jgi:hypothetical protein